jgi:hypothetical protein
VTHQFTPCAEQLAANVTAAATNNYNTKYDMYKLSVVKLNLAINEK